MEEKCRECGATIVDTHREEADVGVGIIYGPLWLLCGNGHTYSPEDESAKEVDKSFRF
jgi:hypothetical protein